MTRTFARSDECYREAKRWTPGASQTGSKAPGRAGPLGGYPLFLARGKNSRVTDVDGNTYIDLIASLAAVGLGHANRQVRNAVIRVINDGALLSLPTKLESEASEALCLMTGWAEQVRWVKTGSEATEAAVRIARCATGRDKVMTVRGGYHAWHSWFQAVKPMHPGVPSAMTELVHGVDYGVVDTKELGTRAYAAMILEPAPITGCEVAMAKLYLKRLQEECRRVGTLLIFDEVVWGLRLSESGGTGIFDVIPDLACYGKALGNGVPVGAVVGRSFLMEHAQYISGTFGGDQMGLAAAKAVLQLHRGNALINRMWEAGLALQSNLNLLRIQGGTFRCSGFSVHPVVELHVEGEDDAAVMSYLLQRLAQHGVLYHPAGGNTMACLTQREIRKVVTAFSRALSELELRLSMGGALTLAGDAVPYKAAFARAR